MSSGSSAAAKASDITTAGYNTDANTALNAGNTYDASYYSNMAGMNFNNSVNSQGNGRSNGYYVGPIEGSAVKITGKDGSNLGKANWNPVTNAWDITTATGGNTSYTPIGQGSYDSLAQYANTANTATAATKGLSYELPSMSSLVSAAQSSVAAPTAITPWSSTTAIPGVTNTASATSGAATDAASGGSGTLGSEDNYYTQLQKQFLANLDAKLADTQEKGNQSILEALASQGIANSGVLIDKQNDLAKSISAQKMDLATSWSENWLKDLLSKDTADQQIAAQVYATNTQAQTAYNNTVAQLAQAWLNGDIAAFQAIAQAAQQQYENAGNLYTNTANTTGTV